MMRKRTEEEDNPLGEKVVRKKIVASWKEKDKEKTARTMSKIMKKWKAVEVAILQDSPRLSHIVQDSPR